MTENRLNENLKWVEPRKAWRITEARWFSAKMLTLFFLLSFLTFFLVFAIMIKLDPPLHPDKNTLTITKLPFFSAGLSLFLVVVYNSAWWWAKIKTELTTKGIRRVFHNQPKTWKYDDIKSYHFESLCIMANIYTLIVLKNYKGKIWKIALDDTVDKVRLENILNEYRIKKMSKIGFIGAGNMAAAIINGIINKNVRPANDIYIADIDSAKTQSFQQQLSINIAADAVELVKTVDVVVLSVKPQVMATVLDSIKGSANTDTVFVSIAAGITVEKITACLGDVPVIRVMPNTPALVGQGMAGLYANEKAQATLVQVQAIFAAVGKAIVVKDESLIDAITAVSGSGPAYYFLMMEKMIEAAIELGLSKENATISVLQTAAGAAELAQQSEDSPATLREKVTSPGGTTQAALEVLEQTGFGNAIINAIKQANERSKELSD